MLRHKQYPIKIGLETIYVDDKIRPLIRLLNGLPGVQTLFSCQGGRKPYVMFTCEHRGILKIILDSLFIREDKGLTGIGICEVDVAFGGLRYTIRLKDLRELKPYYQRLKKYIEEQ